MYAPFSKCIHPIILEPDKTSRHNLQSQQLIFAASISKQEKNKTIIYKFFRLLFR